MASSAEQKFHSSIETCLQIASMDKVRRDEYIVDCIGSTEGTFLIEVSPSSLCYVALLYMTTYCLSQFFSSNLLDSKLLFVQLSILTVFYLSLKMI